MNDLLKMKENDIFNKLETLRDELILNENLNELFEFIISNNNEINIIKLK